VLEQLISLVFEANYLPVHKTLIVWSEVCTTPQEYLDLYYTIKQCALNSNQLENHGNYLNYLPRQVLNNLLPGLALLCSRKNSNFSFSWRQGGGHQTKYNHISSNPSDFPQHIEQIYREFKAHGVVPSSTRGFLPLFKHAGLSGSGSVEAVIWAYRELKLAQLRPNKAISYLLLDGISKQITFKNQTYLPLFTDLWQELSRSDGSGFRPRGGKAAKDTKETPPVIHESLYTVALNTYANVNRIEICKRIWNQAKHSYSSNSQSSVSLRMYVSMLKVGGLISHLSAYMFRTLPNLYILLYVLR